MKYFLSKPLKKYLQYTYNNKETFGRIFFSNWPGNKLRPGNSDTTLKTTVRV